MRQNGSARVALIISLGLFAATVAMIASSSALGKTSAPGSRRADATCVPVVGTPCLGGSDSASPSGSSSCSQSPSGSESPSESESASSSESSSGSAPPVPGVAVATDSESPSDSPSGSESPSESPSGSPSGCPGPGGSKFKSRISIGFTRGAFKGRVKSESDKCVPKRNVVLYEDQKGKKSPVGHDVTDKKGHWRVGHLSDVHGKFYATVKKSKVAGGTCLPAKSKTISR